MTRVHIYTLSHTHTHLLTLTHTHTPTHQHSHTLTLHPHTDTYIQTQSIQGTYQSSLSPRYTHAHVHPHTNIYMEIQIHTTQRTYTLSIFPYISRSTHENKQTVILTYRILFRIHECEASAHTYILDTCIHTHIYIHTYIHTYNTL
jgi:hypothetical protein